MVEQWGIEIVSYENILTALAIQLAVPPDQIGEVSILDRLFGRIGTVVFFDVNNLPEEDRSKLERLVQNLLKLDGDLKVVITSSTPIEFSSPKEGLFKRI